MCSDTDIAEPERIDAALLRDFIARALLHDAVADEVYELLYAQVTQDEPDPGVVATSIKAMLTEVFEVATAEDWHALAEQLLANARDVLAATSTEPKLSALEQEIAQERERTAQQLAGRVRFVLSDAEWIALEEALDGREQVDPAFVRLFRRPRQG